MKKQNESKQTKSLKQGKKLQATTPLSRPSVHVATNNIELDSWSFGASN